MPQAAEERPFPERAASDPQASAAPASQPSEAPEAPAADQTIPTAQGGGFGDEAGHVSAAEQTLPTGEGLPWRTDGTDRSGPPGADAPGDHGFSWQTPSAPADNPFEDQPPQASDPTSEPGASDRRAPWGASAFDLQDSGPQEPYGAHGAERPGMPGSDGSAMGAPHTPEGAPVPPGPSEPSETIAHRFDTPNGPDTGGAPSTPPGGFGAAPAGLSYLDETSNPAFPNAERSPFPESDEIPAEAPSGGDAGPGTQTFAVPSDLSAASSDPSGPAGGADDPAGHGDSGGFPPPPVPPGSGGAPNAFGPDWQRGSAASGGAGGYGGPGGPGGPNGPFGDDPAPKPKKRSRKGLFIGIAAAVLAVVLGGGVTAWFVLGRGAGPEGAADSYTAAWAERDYAAMAGLTTGGDAEKVLTAIDENLGVEKAAVELGEVAEGDGGTATAPFTATLTLSGVGDWSYEGQLPLVQQDGEWKVDFSPSAVHPELEEGTTLVRANVRGERGKILAADGSRLDTDDASGSIKMLTGAVGAATAEDVERLGAGYKEGDPVGQGGIQQEYEERLAGASSASIRIAEDGKEEETIEDPDAPVVATIEGEGGQDVTTAIDPAMQDAAAAAVTSQGKPTSLVAVRASTGEVLAVANNAAGFNRAFDGQYAPGSSLKIISYESLLENGMATTDQFNCPKEALGFKNAGDAAYGAQTMSEAFATSCNTALVQEVVQRLSGEQLTATAEEFGMNAELNVGIPARKPSFPQPDGEGMLAAQSIGQGQVISTPLHMATVPAAIADGSWRSPSLVTEPALEDKPEPKPIAHAEQIRPMMRAVVTDGTAKNSGFEGEVYAKTGSAEFGTASGDEELETHAWVVGYKGDVAFAAVVEGGGGGGSVAGPVAAKFANAI
ncbi:penicillin-binding transpeptidase domain-containing protein [Nocardiopsis endophytica]|uniref:penicillin-binding transpeptidase domain-containing protein n=1 Tax=Nocardiopsis endophytica TaxID=3018445 RepID=UPI0022E1BBFE|nr:penicillin-binding transpeptidase domain-containing protein [Nocardiopsis endophytica]